MELREQIAKILYGSVSFTPIGHIAQINIEQIIDAILALPSFREMREDAEAYRALRDNTAPCPAARLDDCPWCKEKGQGKIKEWKEKAEKWDEIPFIPCSKGLQDKPYCSIAEGYNLTMSRMEVRVKCQCLEKYPGVGTLGCKSCHGTGYVVRAATPEEVRELIEWILLPTSIGELRVLKEYSDGYWYFLTSKGGKLRMKGG